MPKVVIQAGHQNTKNNVIAGLRGSTGAPGEVDFNIDIANQVSAELRKRNFTVKQTDANANSDSSITNSDWDLFLAIHYEADVHNTNGYFVAAPDPSVDSATKESTRIRDVISSEYSKLGIPNHPEWQNPNTSYYYMWQSLSAKTPCVLIECGVGWRVPKDSDTLNSPSGRKKVVESIVRGICQALNVQYDNPASTPTPSGTMPDYLKNLFSEKGLDLNNESQVRGYFGKADKYDQVLNDLNSTRTALDNLKQNIKQLVS